MLASRLLHQDKESVFDVTKGASNTGYREIVGVVPSSGERVRLLCWALVFADSGMALTHYESVVNLLSEVDGDGRAIFSFSDDPVNSYGSLSERTDLIGDLATIWVTATARHEPARGAVLASANGTVVHLLDISPYSATGEDRAIHMIERLAVNMASRLSEPKLPPGSDTMSRLPILGDLDDTLASTRITYNRYIAPS